MHILAQGFGAPDRTQGLCPGLQRQLLIGAENGLREHVRRIRDRINEKPRESANSPGQRLTGLDQSEFRTVLAMKNIYHALALGQGAASYETP